MVYYGTVEEECGKRVNFTSLVPRIFGGQVSEPDAWPWQVRGALSWWLEFQGLSAGLPPVPSPALRGPGPSVRGVAGGSPLGGLRGTLLRHDHPHGHTPGDNLRLFLSPPMSPDCLFSPPVSSSADLFFNPTVPQ
ncbi:hypothetical protein LAZ67_15003175 [Cordylochernes scorpioides]|uniref:Uncharacterized protein n=1 Tax=Cordylochernes scorpioides TaxID=51811 RepID=A0ABY6LCQ6_9ARAC|nr:hypothetical protein LAZ67_15003175 [Cordylochernes scorpioides]